MDFSNDTNKIKELLEKAQDVLVVTHERPTADGMGSTLALYLGLSGLGKRVTVACPDPMLVEHSSFVGANKIISSLGKKNFVISLDYVDGSIEKVSYNIEGDKFNLVIEPRPGFEIFNQDKVHYSYAGSSAQLIFTVDTIHLGGLKKLFDEDKDLFASKPIVNVDRHPNNAHYGHTNMVDPQASSTAELVAQLLMGLGVALTQDIATNLLNAVYGATNSFQNAEVSAGAFELAAQSLKAGGKRFQPKADQPLAETPTVELTTWTDEAGFSFKYPKDLSVNKHEEDPDNYAHVELTNNAHPGKIIVWASDAPSVWPPKGTSAIDTTLGGQPAKKIFASAPVKMLSVGMISDNILFNVEAALTDNEYWQKVHDTIVGSFEFTDGSESEPSSGDSVSSGESADEEEIVE